MDEEGQLQRRGRVAGHRFLLHQQRSIQGCRRNLYIPDVLSPQRTVLPQFCNMTRPNPWTRFTDTSARNCVTSRLERVAASISATSSGSPLECHDPPQRVTTASLR